MLDCLFPPVTVPRTDHDLLMKVVVDARRSGRRGEAAEFLLSELRRARVVDEIPYGAAVVMLREQVTFRVDWGPTESRRLVCPGECLSAEDVLSVLSPVGAGLIGLSAGDRMPFVEREGTLHFVSVVGLGRPPGFLNSGNCGI